MEVVFRFASRVIVMVGGRLLVEGTPGGDRRRSARARGLSRPVASWLRRCLRSTTCAPAMAMSIVLDGISLELAEGGSLAVLGRNGVGKTTLLLTIMGFTRVASGGMRWRGRDIGRLAPHRRARLGIGWVRAGARDLSVADGRGEPDGRRAGADAGTFRPSTGCFRASRSGGGTWETICPAASSRCWRSPAR